MGSTVCMKDGFIPGLVLDGRFEVVSPLNHGSFGMVFLAKDLSNDEMVAIKCLTKTPNAGGVTMAAKDDITVELFCHERLGHHPNLVNLIHSFQSAAHLYLVLEFCSMGDLYEAIRLGHGPLETKNVREFMLQLINAVDYMHSRGLYHRDIKPENIFLTQDGNVKLGDFGLATNDPWSYESSVGSDRYMAPEQYDCSDTGYSPAKADTWAIGICLLNVLFSRNPFVTPTESDVLFADFARDNQSLFDIFPNMSQNTFDVLIHSMAIDPSKRSLSAVRESLAKVVSFTTEEEVLDDFCAEERDVIQASANREPLRTPSISSPQVGQDAFPWAKALQSSPQKPGRQLSVIHDTESYTEDLFSGSENRDSWYSAAQNSSLTSGIDSILGASVKSMVLNPPPPRNFNKSKPVPVAGSLPMRSSKPLPTLSSIFGRKGSSTVSKSWTDLWDEEEEEFVEHEEALKRRREYNSRTWSQESKDNEPTLGRSGLSEIKNAAIVNSRTRSPGQEPEITDQGRLSAEADGFIFEDANISPTTPRYSPPSKRSAIMDKWSALGNRRRAFHQVDEENNEKRPFAGNWRDGLGLKGLATGRSGRFGRGGKTEVAKNKVRDWRQNTPAAPQHDSEWVEGDLVL